MEHVIFVRKKDDGGAEAVVAEFQNGITGFVHWVNTQPDKLAAGLEQNGGKWGTPLAGEPNYETETKANTFAMALGTRVHVACWRLDDFEWMVMKSQLAEEQQVTGRVGRPGSAVRALHTWRKWAKKEGAVI